MNKTMKVEGPLHVACQCDKCKAQPEQEPVAWVCMNYNKHDIDFDQPKIDAIPIGTMLYTHPQRTWVGLTQDEIIQFAHASSHNHKWYYIIEGTKKASPTEMRFLTRFSKLVAQHERKKFSLVLKQLHNHYSFASKTEFKENIND